MGKKIAAIKEKEYKREERVLAHLANKKQNNRKEDRLFNKSIFNVDTYISKSQKTSLKSFMIRPIENFKFKTKSSDDERINKEISKYLFEKFQVPNMLRPEKCTDILLDKAMGERSYKCTYGNSLQWYFCVAQGGSLYKKYLKGIFTKKEVHIFLTQKVANDIGNAFVFAVAMSESNNYSLATTLSRTKIGEKFEKLLMMRNINTLMTIYEDVQKKCLNEYINMIRLFSRIMEKKTLNEIDDIVDYVINRMENDQTYSVVGKGYTYDNLKKATENWHHDLRRSKLSTEFIGKKWIGYGLGDQDVTIYNENDEKITWTFSEILDGAALDREGKVQRHCVYSYLSNCMSGSCSVIRLHNGGYKSLVTLEVRKGKYGSMNLCQARRFANQTPKEQEKRFILKWAKLNNINVGEYLF